MKTIWSVINKMEKRKIHKKDIVINIPLSDISQYDCKECVLSESERYGSISYLVTLYNMEYSDSVKKLFSKCNAGKEVAIEFLAENGEACIVDVVERLEEKGKFKIFDSKCSDWYVMTYTNED